MKNLRILTVLCIFLSLTACTSSNVKRHDDFRKLEQHEILPQTAFVTGDDLFIRYQYEGKTFFLTADLENTHTEGAVEATPLSVWLAKGDEEKNGSYPVAVVGKEWLEILKETLQPLVPENKSEGVLILIKNYETVLFRKADGTADLKILGDVEPDIKITNKISSEKFSNLIYAKLLEMVKESGTKYTRFLLRLDGVPLSPFMYVDTKKGLSLQLQLPPYYEVKKEMTSLGFSTSFIYSFFIKSHLFETIKAPFTTFHRLFCFGTSSLYTAFPPSVRNLKKVPELNSSEEEMDLASFNNWLDKKISKQNYKARVELLIDGEEFFTHLKLAMQQAKESIFVRLYIFIADPYGMSLADLMKSRAKEGVDVRVLLDELNVVMNSGKNPELAAKEDFVMPKYITHYLRKNSSAKARTRLNPWASFDHTKVYLIDNKLAYTGGMNIGEEYRYKWHDMMVALEGPVVGRLTKNFYQAWSYAGWGGDYAAAWRKIFGKDRWEDIPAEPDMIDVRLMYTKPNDSEIFAAQREAIRRAKRRIYIQNAYFSDDRIVRELIEARGRGVDVRVIFPGENNVGIMDKNNRYMANKLLRNGVRVYFYKGMTHVKAAIYDGWAVVGSANFDKMSLYVNGEMSLGISDPSFVRELETRLFQRDFENSEELTEPLRIAWTYGIVSALANQL